MLVLEMVFRSQKAQHSEYFNLRMQRTLSWFKQALQLDARQLDLKFISLWVAFKAMCARETDAEETTLQPFLDQMFQHDAPHRIEYMIWSRFPQAIRFLLQSPYAFQSYWDYQNQKISKLAWQQAFERDQQQWQQAWQEQDALHILHRLFHCLQTLGQQLLQGGSSYHSSVNRTQLSEACSVLSGLLSGFMFILLENAQALDQPQPFYPVVQFS
ncbi:hypothetical protein [Acinetobacter sp. GSS19]|uniref:hypothetical protein n=1 Tax=Acinetobacter sp. GSS19 TaxID=3020716 RepID=UPI00236051AD|nr:hypothetical protein [Acinetobacter sp. GSS19]